MNTTQELLDRYYQSIQDKTDVWQEMWASNSVFADASKTLHTVGKDAVIASFTPFLKGVKDIEISTRIINDNNACYVIEYTYSNQHQELMRQSVAEVWSVNHDQLVSLTIFFDLTAYRTFIRS